VRVAQRVHEGIGDVAHVHRLEARIGAGQRHHGRWRCRRANMFRKLSPGPNTTEGRKMVAATAASAARAASPSALERWYIDGPSRSAPSALMCR
jgi:hypothetical protein